MILRVCDIKKDMVSLQIYYKVCIHYSQLKAQMVQKHNKEQTVRFNHLYSPAARGYY